MTSYSWLRHAAAHGAAVVLALAGSGCAPSLAGRWLGDGETPRNVMTIGSDGTGKATIYFVFTSDPANPHSAKFEIDWTARTSSAYTLTMTCFECDSGCDDQSFTMSCDATSESSGDQAGSLSCTGDGSWNTYPLHWSANPE